MDFSCIDINILSSRFLKDNINLSFKELNTFLKDKSGIVNFFTTEKDFIQLKETLTDRQPVVAEHQMEYGDYQTNRQLAQSVCNYLSNKKINPKILLEPTCGKGNFIVSAIQTFGNLTQVFGIEIQEKYIWELKFALLEYFLTNTQVNKPKIYLYNANIFEFDFQRIKQQINGQELLVIGNPPWVTNTMLSTLRSGNLPEKSNFKRLKGIDAITGKGNFDIGEFIALKMLNLFSTENGHFSFLIKNSVIKNIVYEQRRNKYSIANIEKHTIDAQKEFGAAVDASLFFCRFNAIPEFTAKEFDFYTLQKRAVLGWVNDKFASNMEKYKQYQDFDGICPFEWRQGIKHDCSKVMEFERKDGLFVNALDEQFDLEEDLVYGLVKSSDLKENVIQTTRKFTIVTQRKIGQDTIPILEKLPKTKTYLFNHKDYFLKRKSNIYKGKPAFSIFGIGDYSFKPYKVAISGLYKQTQFTLVKPNGKALLLDDTCYFIGFDNEEEALITQFLLNKPETQEFIQSFIFFDAKRAITKDLLMRINIRKIAENTQYSEIDKIISSDKWDTYKMFNKECIKSVLF